VIAVNATAEQPATRDEFSSAVVGAPSGRGRWHRNRSVIGSGLLLLTAAVLVTVLVGPARLPGNRQSPAHPHPAASTAVPSLIVAWTGHGQIEVLSSRNSRVIRTLASNVAEIRGLPHLALSASGTLFFDDALGTRERLLSVPVGGGPVTRVAADAALPAVSSDGRLLAYVTNTEWSNAPEAIVVHDLITGAEHRWAFAAQGPDVTAISWSPDGRHLSFTEAPTQLGLSYTGARSWVLDTRQATGSLAGARRIPLGGRLSWAGYLTPRSGVAVIEGPFQTVLVRVDIATGRIIRVLTTLAQPLFTGNINDGPEAAVQIDPTGHYFLIAGAGKTGYGQIFWWTFGMRGPAPIVGGVVRAIWGHAGPD